MTKKTDKSKATVDKRKANRRRPQYGGRRPIDGIDIIAVVALGFVVMMFLMGCEPTDSCPEGSYYNERVEGCVTEGPDDNQ